MRASSSAVRGPVVSQPERRVSATASISSSPIAGRLEREERQSRLDESSGIGGDEAYALGGRVRPRRRPRRGVAPTASTAPARSEPRRSGVEHEARLAVDPHLRRPRALRHLDRLEHPGRRDEEARDGAADPRLGRAGTASGLAERRGDREAVQVDARPRPRRARRRGRRRAGPPPRSPRARPARSGAACTRGRSRSRERPRLVRPRRRSDPGRGSAGDVRERDAEGGRSAR